MSVNMGAGDYNTLYETTGQEGSLCLVHSDITAPEGSDSNGLYFNCKIQPEVLTGILNEWAQGHYSTSNGIPQNSEECEGTIG
ncbi:MAG: hypothetical protein V1834_04490 [Candidatus Micrarchaeota archaeon]